jgi:glycosyltransferase involved in cell wall biosynthesis
VKGARIIHHIHAFGFLDYYEAGGRLRRAAIRAMLRRADALIALTDGMARQLRRIAPGQSVDILPNPVDLGGLRIAPTPVRDRRLVLFLGWFIPEKGIYELLEAVALARRDVPDIRLALGGFRNERAVHERVRALGIEDRVEFRGWLSRADVARSLRECAVLALPSYSEGFGLVLVEAMACGTPIVTCPVGGIPEVVQSPRNAVFVPTRDAKRLGAALVRVLTDQALWEAMSVVGPKDAERFDTHYILDGLRAIYHRLLTPRTGVH